MRHRVALCYIGGKQLLDVQIHMLPLKDLSHGIEKKTLLKKTGSERIRKVLH